MAGCEGGSNVFDVVCSCEGRAGEMRASFETSKDTKDSALRVESTGEAERPAECWGREIGLLGEDNDSMMARTGAVKRFESSRLLLERERSSARR